MKNKTKKVAALISCILALNTGFLLAGCEKTPDTNQTLQVYVQDLGYGYNWCVDLLDAFKQKDWVKSKYSELEIIFEQNEESTYLRDRMDAGASSNTVDLFFTTSGNAYMGVDKKGEPYFAELSESVYNTVVPGENVTVYEKLLPSYRDSVRYYERGQDTDDSSIKFSSYTLPWASGFSGIFYNADILEELGIELPLTTDAFIAACDKISLDKTDDYAYDYVIMRSGDAAYWEYFFPIWWAQYEGVDNYYNFYNGKDARLRSNAIFAQEGRRQALGVLEEILDYETGYNYPFAASANYMSAQTLFFEGHGVFMANGDWLEEEMKEMKLDIEAERGFLYDIRLMKTPVISSIVNVAPSIKTAAAQAGIDSDEMLKRVVAKIDEGFTEAESAGLVGVSQPDYLKVMEARGIVHSIGPGHTSTIPAYANGKEVAFDFLRFMATDEALEIYIKSTGGASLPFDYDLKEKNSELYSSLWKTQQNRLDYNYEVVYPINVLPETSMFPLVKYGRLGTLHSLNSISLVTYFGSEGASGTAEKLYSDDISYWTTERFRKCLQDAGL